MHNFQKCLILSLFVLLCSFLTAQSAKIDYSKDLQKDFVELVDGNYIHSSYFITKIQNQNFQVKLYSSAPIDVLSRDNFVMYTTSLFTMISTAMLFYLNDEKIAIEDIRMIELDEPIGDVDMSMTITMTKNGLQLKFFGQELNENITMTWDEIFED